MRHFYYILIVLSIQAFAVSRVKAFEDPIISGILTSLTQDGFLKCDGGPYESKPPHSPKTHYSLQVNCKDVTVDFIFAHNGVTPYFTEVIFKTKGTNRDFQEGGAIKLRERVITALSRLTKTTCQPESSSLKDPNSYGEDIFRCPFKNSKEILEIRHSPFVWLRRGSIFYETGAPLSFSTYIEPKTIGLK